MSFSACRRFICRLARSSCWGRNGSPEFIIQLPGGAFLLRSSKAAATLFWTVSELSIGKNLLATKVLELGMTTAKVSQNERASEQADVGARRDDRRKEAERGERRGEKGRHGQETQDLDGQGGRDACRAEDEDDDEARQRPGGHDGHHRQNGARELAGEEGAPGDGIGQRQGQRLRFLFSRNGVEGEEQGDEAHDQGRDERPAQLVEPLEKGIGAAALVLERRRRSRR